MNAANRVTSICFLVALALLIFSAFYTGLTVTNYEIKTTKLQPGQELTVVLLSDLHGTIYSQNQQKLIDTIRAQKPDLILLAGDINDELFSTKASTLLFAGIEGMAPAYYVPGNHEYRSRREEEFKDLARSYGITVLEDELQTFSINNINLEIGGATDPEKERFEAYDANLAMQQVFGSMQRKDNAYQILIAHHPERIGEYKKYPFDLVVSGHAHGGQVRIPFLLKNGLVAPDQGLFPKYTGGFYKHEGLNHIVGRGLSVYLIPRVYNPPEVVTIHISGEDIACAD